MGKWNFWSIGISPRRNSRKILLWRWNHCCRCFSCASDVLARLLKLRVRKFPILSRIEKSLKTHEAFIVAHPSKHLNFSPMCFKRMLQRNSLTFQLTLKTEATWVCCGCSAAEACDTRIDQLIVKVTFTLEENLDAQMILSLFIINKVCIISVCSLCIMAYLV